MLGSIMFIKTEATKAYLIVIYHEGICSIYKYIVTKAQT